MRKVNSSYIYILLVLLLIFGLFQLSVFRLYGFSLYPDEFGYWSTAASMIGYDWSDVASLGSYYSFGYSLLLTPVLFIFKGGVTAYRAAIAVNYILIALGFVVLYRLSIRLFGYKNDSLKRIMACSIAVLYPPWILYSQMTMAESLLIFIFLLICYLMLEYIYSPGILKIVLLIGCLLYLYSIHMRTIGVILAAVVTFAILGLTDKKSRKFTIVLIILAVAAVLLFVLLKRRTIANVFSQATSTELEVNGYGNQLWKIKHIFSRDGFTDFLIEVAGKVYYLIVSTYGLLIFATVAMGRGVKKILRGIKRSVRISASSYFMFFLLTSTVAEVLIASIFLHTGDRADVVFYGRYDEFLAPMIIVLGLYEIFEWIEKGRLNRFLAFVSGISLTILIAAPLFTMHMERMDYPAMRGYFVSGIGYLNEFNEYTPGLFTWRAALVGVLLMMVLFLTILLSTGIKGGSFLLGIMIVTQILMGFRLSDQWTYRINGYVHSNMGLMEEFVDNPDRTLYYLDIDDNYYVDFFQFGMPKREFVIVSPEGLDALDMKNGYLIVNWSYPGIEELKTKYSYYMESEMMFAFYDE